MRFKAKPYRAREARGLDAATCNSLQLNKRAAKGKSILQKPLANVRVRGPEWASRKKLLNRQRCVFFFNPQAIELPQQNRPNYDKLMSGLVEYLFNEMNHTRGAQSYGAAGVNQDSSASVQSVSLFLRALNGNSSNYDLSDTQFADIVRTGVKESWTPVKFPSGQDGFAVSLSTYSTDWGLAIGRGTLYLDANYRPVGFYDRYDPNPQQSGARTIRNEALTTLLRGSGASEFNICYGQVGASRAGKC